MEDSILAETIISFEGEQDVKNIKKQSGFSTRRTNLNEINPETTETEGNSEIIELIGNPETTEILEKLTIPEIAECPQQYVYSFLIVLKGIKPKIWRRIQVPSYYTFFDLHCAIQDSMGWFNCHLHDFDIRNPETGNIDRIGNPKSYVGCILKPLKPTIPEHVTRISKYFLTPKDKAIYLYDFGDGWEHRVELEKILPAESGTEYPVCIDGRCACPPEDCGGARGYEKLLKILADPNHEEHKQRVEWLEMKLSLEMKTIEDYSSERFEPSEVFFIDPKETWNMFYSDDELVIDNNL